MQPTGFIVGNGMVIAQSQTRTTEPILVLEASLDQMASDRQPCTCELCSERGALPVTDYQNTLTPKQAAKYVGISEAALRLWRSEGRGPRYFKAGEKLVRYRRTDLDAWIEARLVTAEQYGPLEDGSK